MTEPQAAESCSLQDWLSAIASFAQRRMDGNDQTDEFGFDPELTTSVLMPMVRWLYQNWFRVRMHGLQNVPDAGAALVVANHAGVLPLDMIMVQVGIHYEHPRHRNLRLLGAEIGRAHV